MKFTHIPLLSTLIVFGFFMPVTANDEEILASAPIDPTLSIAANETVKTAVSNWFSGCSNTKIGATFLVVGGAGIAIGYGIYRLMGGHQVALKAQEGLNKTLEQETAFKLRVQREAKLAQDEARIQDAQDFIAKLPYSLNDQEYIEKVIHSNEYQNRITGFYHTCEEHKNKLAYVSDPELKEQAQQVRTQLEKRKTKAQAIPALRVLQDKEDKDAEELTEMRLNNALRARQEEQLRLINENIKKNDERNEETHKVHRAAIQKMEKEMKKISTNIAGIHNWQQTSIKQIDRYMPSIAAASQNCANLKDALNNVATQEQLTHGMASLAKAFGHESILMKALAGIQQNQNTQSAQLTTQNNKLDAQSAKLSELEKKIGATEQKVAKLAERNASKASMSNPANWDARKDSIPTPAASKKDNPANETSRLDPANETAH